MDGDSTGLLIFMEETEAERATTIDDIARRYNLDKNTQAQRVAQLARDCDEPIFEDPFDRMQYEMQRSIRRAIDGGASVQPTALAKSATNNITQFLDATVDDAFVGELERVTGREPVTPGVARERETIPLLNMSTVDILDKLGEQATTAGARALAHRLAESARAELE